MCNFSIPDTVFDKEYLSYKQGFHNRDPLECWRMECKDTIHAGMPGESRPWTSDERKAL